MNSASSWAGSAGSSVFLRCPPTLKPPALRSWLPRVRMNWPWNFGELVRLLDQFVAQGLVPDEDAEDLRELDRFLGSFSGPDHESLWLLPALETSAEWNEVRRRIGSSDLYPGRTAAAGGPRDHVDRLPRIQMRQYPKTRCAPPAGGRSFGPRPRKLHRSRPCPSGARTPDGVPSAIHREGEVKVAWLL